MIWATPVTDISSDPSAILGAICLMLITLVGLGVRSLITGKLVPQATVDREKADLTQQVAAQAETIKMAADYTAQLAETLRMQAGSIEDFSEATRLNVRVAEALRKNLTDGEHVV